MLVEGLVESTVQLQGFHVLAVNYEGVYLSAELAPDCCYRPCCGQCNRPAR
jgi:hypothetical protein